MLEAHIAAMPPREGGAPAPSDNIYVTDLPLGIDDDTLKAIFESFSPVVQHRVLPNMSGQAKSAALVRFDSVETASWIVTTLDGQVPSGLTTPISVRFADPPKPKVQRPGPYDAPGAHIACGGEDSGKGRQVQLDNLYIKHLPVTTDESEVRQVFSQYGTVLQCRVLKNPGTCAALVRFSSAEEAQWVMETLQGNIPEGYMNAVEIKYYEPKGKGAEAMGGAPVGKGGSFSGCWGGNTGKASGSGVIWGPAADFDYGPGKGDLNAAEPHINGKGAFKGFPPKGQFSMKEIVAGFEKSGALPGGTGYENNEACLYVSGLPADADDVDLYRLFNPFGAITTRGVKVMKRPDGQCKGFGFVNFQDVDAAQLAIASFHDTVLPDDSILSVTVKAEPSRRAGK